MAYRNLLLSLEGRVAVLTVNRPKVRNALDGPTVSELHRALGEVRTARSTVLIVTGAGDKAFVSGADIHGLRERRRDDALASMNSRLMTEVESHDAVVIAAVNGVALGGGCELALACDLRVAAEHAVFGLPEPSLGIIPGAGGTQRLPRIVGLGRAKEMILGGARWDARKALEAGLVSEVVPRSELMKAARRSSRSGNPPSRVNSSDPTCATSGASSSSSASWAFSTPRRRSRTTIRCRPARASASPCGTPRASGRWPATPRWPWPDSACSWRSFPRGAERVRGHHLGPARDPPEADRAPQRGRLLRRPDRLPRPRGCRGVRLRGEPRARPGRGHARGAPRSPGRAPAGGRPRVDHSGGSIAHEWSCIGLELGPERVLGYSLRSAHIGSSRDARRAGR